MDSFISEEILKSLSYKSALGRSLKQISLRDTPVDEFYKILPDTVRLI